MVQSDGAESGHDPEAPQEELDDELQLLLHFGKYGEARRALPWQQWTFREKTNYCVDRVFLGLLVIFLLLLLGECGYKIWFVSNVNKIGELVVDSSASLFNWLFTQERHEELAEL